MQRLTSTLLLALAMFSSSAYAVVLDLRPAGGGSQQIYDLGGGEFLGLWGISGGAGDLLGVETSTDVLFDGFGLGQDSILGFYYADPYGAGEWAGEPEEFSLIDGSFTIESLSSASGTGKLWDSFWVHWSGGGLFNEAGNSNMQASATLQGTVTLDFGSSSVSEPTTLLMLALGLIGIASRRRLIK